MLSRVLKCSGDIQQLMDNDAFNIFHVANSKFESQRESLYQTMRKQERDRRHILWNIPPIFASELPPPQFSHQFWPQS